MFVNLTFVETRVHKHMYYVFESSDAEFFCTEEVPAGFKNVIPPGLCGRNGYIQSSSKFATASHDKDGVAHIFAATGVLDSEAVLLEAFHPVPVFAS